MSSAKKKKQRHRKIDDQRREEVWFGLKMLCGAEVAGIISHIIDNNPSANLPYHGTPHLYVVALAALKLAREEGLDQNDQRTVFLAALFHDFNHQRNDDDTINVKAAIEAVYEYLDMSDHGLFIDQDKIASVVKASRWPYLHEANNKMDEILRDADILYSTILVSDAQRFRNGLVKERGYGSSTELDSLAFIIGHGINTVSAGKELHEFMTIGAKNSNIHRWED